MSRVETTPQARTDIREIALRIALEGSLEQSQKFTADLDRKFQLYATQPQMARERSELSAGLRSFPFGNYVVFFRPLSEDGLEVVRVLWAGRDIPPLFEP